MPNLTYKVLANLIQICNRQAGTFEVLPYTFKISKGNICSSQFFLSLFLVSVVRKFKYAILRGTCSIDLEDSSSIK